MRKYFLFLLMIVAVPAFFGGCGKGDHAHAKAQKYHCPMHPTYVSDKPGDCPICNMKLVPIKDDGATAAPAATAKVATAAKPGQYTCPMHPEVVSDKPGQCPKCGMNLEVVGPDGHIGNPGVPGRVTIAISPEKQQLIGLTTETVQMRKLVQPVRATATLEHDETRLARISLRFAGWVRELRVNYTGQVVQKGDPLFTVYSPDLYSAESEYLLAFERLTQVQGRGDVAQIESAKRLVESSRRRLALWQIGDEEIKAIEETRQARDETLVRSPVSGHVVAKTALAGKSFMAGETLYEIADLMNLWVRASVSEFDAALIKQGQPAKVIFPQLGNRVVESRVSFLYPHLDPQTRRMEVRLEIMNHNHELRPQMWADVEFEANYGDKLSVPASALIDTGLRRVAFVAREDGHLEPRDVKVGVHTDDFYEVVDGLKDGEKVVSRALFLIDSESQLKAAIAGMGAAGGHNH